jgi:hypothetical protein
MRRVNELQMNIYNKALGFNSDMIDVRVINKGLFKIMEE